MSSLEVQLRERIWELTERELSKCKREHPTRLMTFDEVHAIVQVVFDETLADKVSVDRKQLSEIWTTSEIIDKTKCFKLHGDEKWIPLDNSKELFDEGKTGKETKPLVDISVEKSESQEKLKELLAGSGEPLNLALAFANVKKKKGSVKEAKQP